ncbi:MAG: hypothetical protein F6K22_24460 [Okeania sp. SIO2F4]|uniref:hypothetical protein n=1 Tax=Okeania sp. SIO2F4 TaxID=2607790 RepID=UPI00142BA547|nr:hypothetical protein [Okeania sp. SIO2F4]NES05685.1 hypothetical protein [Okeania sp. SIO2F4]
MVEPISSLIIWGLTTLLLGAYVISIYLLTIVALVDLLEDWATDNYVDEDDVGFVTKAISAGNCSHIGGVWNKRTNKVRDAWKIKAQNVDSNVSSKLRQSDVLLIS